MGISSSQFRVYVVFVPCSSPDLLRSVFRVDLLEVPQSLHHR